MNIVADCESHLILAVETGRGPSPDARWLKKTLCRLPQSVTLNLLLGDAGYDSEENHNVVRKHLACNALIPPRIGRPTRKPATGFFRRAMQKIFRKKPPIFGQRWQVETTFSMLKRNLSSSLTARNYWTQSREMALRVITHNLMICANV